MKKHVKILLILAAALISIGTVLSLVGIVTGVQMDRILYDGILDVPFYQEQRDVPIAEDNRYTVSPKDIHSISIDWYDGTVTVEPYDGDEILLEESSNRKLTEKNAMLFHVRKGTLSIQSRPASSGLFLSSGSPEKNLHVSLPKNLAQDLKDLSVDAVDAELTLQGLHAKALSIDSVDGPATLQNFKTNTLEINAVDADFLLQGVQIQALTVDTADGDFTVENSQVETLHLDTIDGDLIGHFSLCPKEISIDSADGNAELTLPSDSQFTAQWNLSGGTYASDFTGSYQNGTHMVGDGSSRISMDSMDGNLHIQKQPTSQGAQ